jgi:hypothetical protein
VTLAGGTILMYSFFKQSVAKVRVKLYNPLESPLIILVLLKDTEVKVYPLVTVP